MDPIDFDVICSFTSAPQSCLSIRLRYPHREDDFLSLVREQLSEREQEQLRKLSVCQLNCPDEASFMSWLKENNGKYYYDEGEF